MLDSNETHRNLPVSPSSPTSPIQYSPTISVCDFPLLRMLALTLKQSSLSLISLSLFYSSLTKLFLLFLLTIWLPTTTSGPPLPKITNVLPEWAKHFWQNDGSSNSSSIIRVLEILDDDKLDREWIVRNVVGGMSAGSALRGT